MEAELKEKIRLWKKPSYYKKFSAEQDEALIEARSGDNVVTFAKLVDFWYEMGWGKISKDTLINRYRKLKK